MQLRPVHALIPALMVAALVAWIVYANPGSVDSAKASRQADVKGGGGAISEVDFGFAELDPGGRPVPIPSYKRGGMMVLYAGDELQFQALGDAPLPPLVLRAGEVAQLLPGASGRVRIEGPSKQPLPAHLLAQGERLSLPGGAPPRVSVKVQVFGVARPAS